MPSLEGMPEAFLRLVDPNQIENLSLELSWFSKQVVFGGSPSGSSEKFISETLKFVERACTKRTYEIIEFEGASLFGLEGSLAVRCTGKGYLHLSIGIFEIEDSANFENSERLLAISKALPPGWVCMTWGLEKGIPKYRGRALDVYTYFKLSLSRRGTSMTVPKALLHHLLSGSSAWDPSSQAIIEVDINKFKDISDYLERFEMEVCGVKSRFFYAKLLLALMFRINP